MPVRASGAAVSRGTSAVQRSSITPMVREIGTNAVNKALGGLRERVASMPRSIGGAISSIGALHRQGGAFDGRIDRGQLNVELGSQVNMSSPLRADPQMWTDLMTLLEKYSAVTAETHRKQTELAIAQSMLATDETMRTINQAVEDTNKAMGKALSQLLNHIRVDETLYSNIVRRLRADLRIDRERFGRLRDGMR